MKEFKNWWVRNAPYTDERSAEEGWKAAIEHVLKIADNIEQHGIIMLHELEGELKNESV